MQTCNACQETETWTESKCETCERRKPDLLESNEDAWELWEAVQTQWRASAFGLIGLDYPAVFLVAQALGIKVTESVMDKIRLAEAEVLKQQSEEMKKIEVKNGRN